VLNEEKSNLLIIGRASLSFPITIHSWSAKRTGDQIRRVWWHKVTNCRRYVHPLVCHWIV